MPTWTSNHGSSTAILESEPIELQETHREPSRNNSTYKDGRVLGIHDPLPLDGAADRNESLPSPTTAPQEIVEKWNSPRRNTYCTLAAFWSFAIMGMNDATYGVRDLS